MNLFALFLGIVYTTTEQTFELRQDWTETRGLRYNLTKTDAKWFTVEKTYLKAVSGGGSTWEIQ